MTEFSFLRVREYLAEVADLHGEARAKKLDEIERENPALRAEVESLLGYSESPATGLDQAIFEPATEQPARIPEQIGGYRTEQAK